MKHFIVVTFTAFLLAGCDSSPTRSLQSPGVVESQAEEKRENAPAVETPKISTEVAEISRLFMEASKLSKPIMIGDIASSAEASQSDAANLKVVCAKNAAKVSKEWTPVIPIIHRGCRGPRVAVLMVKQAEVDVGHKDLNVVINSLVGYNFASKRSGLLKFLAVNFPNKYSDAYLKGAGY